MSEHQTSGNGKAKQPMMDVKSIAERERGRGLNVDMLYGASYRDGSTVLVVPTRGTIHYKVASAWENMFPPMNQKRAKLYAVGDEVGRAYNDTMKMVLAHPHLSTFKYVMTLEDDNLPPPDAQVKLLDSLHVSKFDAMSGLYYTKGPLNMPMAFGDPKSLLETGRMDFRPRDIVKALEHGGNILEVNGIAMGCAVWKMELFKEFAPPWFVTVNEFIPYEGIKHITQDLFFCERLRRGGKRLGVDLRVHVGHLDVETGVIY